MYALQKTIASLYTAEINTKTDTMGPQRIKTLSFYAAHTAAIFFCSVYTHYLFLKCIDALFFLQRIQPLFVSEEYTVSIVVCSV